MLDNLIATVSQLHSMYSRSAAETNEAGARQAAVNWAGRCKAVLDYLVNQKRLLTPVSKEFGDVSDLPEALIKELGIVRADELEQQIMAVMQACEGPASLDQLLVGLYRKFKIIQTRRFLQNKLYRMTKRDFVVQISEPKGYFILKSELDQNPFSYVVENTKPHTDLDDDIPF